MRLALTDFFLFALTDIQMYKVHMFNQTYLQLIIDCYTFPIVH